MRVYGMRPSVWSNSTMALSASSSSASARRRFTARSVDTCIDWRLGSSSDRRADLGERIDVPIDILVGMLYRQCPLLLVTGRHEDASVHHPRVRSRVEVEVRVEEVAVVRERRGPVG